MVAFIASFLFSGAFDSLLIQVLGNEEVPRSVRILNAMLIAVGTGTIWLSARHHGDRSDSVPQMRGVETVLRIVVCAIPLWCLIGLLNGWPIGYILGDVFMLSILPLTYFPLSRVPIGDPRRVFRAFYFIMVVVALATAALVIYNNVLSGRSHKMSMDAALPIVYHAMISSETLFLDKALLPFLIVAIVLSTKRGTWAGLVMFLCMALFWRSTKRTWLRFLALCALLAMLLVAASAFLPERVDRALELIDRRLVETVEDVRDPEGELGAQGGGRMAEVLGSIDTIVDRRSPVDWICGMGLGAIVTAREGRTRHHIHSTPAAFLVRTGAAGLSLWLVFNALLLYQLYRRTAGLGNSWLRVQFQFWFGIWLFSFIMSVKSLAFWGHVLGGIQLAYLNRLFVAAALAERRAVRAKSLPSRSKRVSRATLG